MSRQNRRNTGSQQQVRIIGGTWRRRKLAFGGLPGLRPTADRVRETLFNWIHFDLPGAQVLDLFAGSGALGYEALSRGARRAVLVENSAQALKDLENSRQMLGAEGAELVQSDARTYLQQTPGESFEIVFVDPPFQEDFYREVLDVLVSRNWVNAESLIYVEADADLVPDWPTGWGARRQLKAGNVVATLLCSL